ncbi:hypothetical protein F5Y15DRAFT_12909 [Xylariaceae sp. FL0016]|nr:hypothetical protein F5Y15DRAFT_12909 [Xylariaceae sp. FL0016]
MLLRQLHRHLPRSVAATWRSAPVALLHGSSRVKLPCHSRDNSDSVSPFHQASHRLGRAATSEPPTDPGGKTLFDELFPDEAKESQRAQGNSQPRPNDAQRSPWLSGLFGEPPRMTLLDEFSSEVQEQLGLTSNGRDNGEPDEFKDIALRAKSMLILSAASKHLLESDFLRVGTKSKHVEGWVSGILKVIQARDPDTLAPLDHYFILFDSPTSATAYRDEVQRLWSLGKQHIPGAHHKKDKSPHRRPVPEGLLTSQGEDVATLLRGFTLLPPSQTLRLALAGHGEDYQGRAAGMRALLADLDAGGDYVARLQRKLGSKFLVLISLDGGRVALDTLHQVIEADGLERNLPWRILDKEQGGPGIVPFGKSVLKRADELANVSEVGEFQQYLRDSYGWELVRPDASPAPASTSTATSPSPDAATDPDTASVAEQLRSAADARKQNELREVASALDEKGEDERRLRRYPRFLVPFADGPEAHRFVRSFHRRELTLRMGGGEGLDHDDKATQEGKGGKRSWDERRVINASVL